MNAFKTSAFICISSLALSKLNTSIFPTSPTNFSSAGCNMSMHKSTAFGNFGRLTKITSYSGSKNRKLATGTKVIDPQKMEEFNSAQPISVRPSRIPQHSLQYIQQLQKQAWGTMKRLHFSKYKREKSSSQFGFTHKVDVKRILETNDEEKPEKSQNKILCTPVSIPVGSPFNISGNKPMNKPETKSVLSSRPKSSTKSRAKSLRKSGKMRSYTSHENRSRKPKQL
ncbi:unnamed protein product [Moneuplotes crassus]|uniref:Uncharacterized protein n=2 Tax=Euplotes crassus TaxID=5936 RepID=A0AAD1XE78_EUPCR|nr:unnamed protein product [Moneuplotes crassus]